MSQLGQRGRIGLISISLGSRGDGVASVARLVQAALLDLGCHEADSLELQPRRIGSVSFGERIRFAVSLVRLQLGRRPDALLFGHLGLARAQLLIPRPFRRPYAVMLLGIEAWDPALSADRRRTLREAAVRIAISGHTADRVRALQPDIGEIQVCPLSLQPGEDVAISTSSAASADTVLIVGRMTASERYKGHDQLLECWPQVLAQRPGARLIAVGGGDDVTRLRTKAFELGLSEAVYFPGFVAPAELESIWEQTAVFAMPSSGEGFGLVYLEAMRRGLPCIASTEDAAREIVVDGETGFLVDPNDQSALASALVQLLGDPNLRHRLGTAGQERWAREFTYVRFRERLRDVLAVSPGFSPGGGPT